MFPKQIKIAEHFVLFFLCFEHCTNKS